METATEFFKLFLLLEWSMKLWIIQTAMLLSISNEGSQRTYAQPDSSWKDTKADEI